MDFVTAIKTCFGKYATFRGRASRSEYWYFTLFLMLVQTIATVIDSALALDIPVLYSVTAIALLVPGIAVAVRRLHDTDRSGWWYFIVAVPLVGIIVLLVWFCTRGTVGANRFGDDSLPGEVAVVSNSPA